MNSIFLFYFILSFYITYCMFGGLSSFFLSSVCIYGNMANGGKLLNCQICCGNNGQGRSSLTDTDRSILYTGSSSILLVIGQ